jgi:stage V sporulation protein R
VGYHRELSRLNQPAKTNKTRRIDFYFDEFLQTLKKLKLNEYLKEIDRYNDCIRENNGLGETVFISDISKLYPEFEAIYAKHQEEKAEPTIDLLHFLLEHSGFLNDNENKWMKSVVEVTRKTSLFFQPQIRTKIMNEGWASYWHEDLFLKDDRINGHEVDFAKVNAGVTSLPRVGINPYALGMRMFYDVEERADKGKYSIEFMRILDADTRKKFDNKTGKGREFIFKVRENFCDFMFINTFVDQDFINKNKLFVAGKRLNQQRMVWEYYVKSRKSEDYRQMLLNSLYHPPHLKIDTKKNENGSLYLVHEFEGKPLVKDYIQNTMMGIEYLWGGPVKLETSDAESSGPSQSPIFSSGQTPPKKEIKWQRVLYTMDKRKLTKQTIQ